MIVAGIGFVINLGTALLFMRDQHNDLNARGAYLHMMADAGVSIGVVISGAIIMFTGWSILDPLVSIAIVAVILLGTWGLLKDSVGLAMDAAPGSVDVAAVREALLALPGVCGRPRPARLGHVHDLDRPDRPPRPRPRRPPRPADRGPDPGEDEVRHRSHDASARDGRDAGLPGLLDVSPPRSPLGEWGGGGERLRELTEGFLPHEEPLRLSASLRATSPSLRDGEETAPSA